MTLLQNGERYRHAVESVQCGIDRSMNQQVDIGHVTPTKVNMAANMAAELHNVVIKVGKYNGTII